MLRAMLLGCLVASVSACSKSSTESSAKVQPGVVAGKVLEAKGSVTVKHAGATRPLVVGETVEGDDTVITGADGNVVIELAHNSARWELGANKTSKVSESIAWNAKKATAQEIDEASAAAGRPAERSAAGTVATAAADKESDEGAKKDEAPGAPEAAMAEPSPAAPAEADMGSKGADAPKRAERHRAAPKAAAAPQLQPAPAPPPPPPPRSTSRAPIDDAVAAPSRTRGGGESMKRAPQAATAPSISGGATASANAAPPAGGASQSAVPAPGGAPNPGALLAAHAADLRKCMRDAGAKEDVTLAIAIANGKPTVKVTSKAAVSAGLDACMKAAVAKIQFSGTSTVTRIVKP